MTERYLDLIEAQVAADAAYVGDLTREAMMIACNQCESPIERMMCAALMSVSAPGLIGQCNWGFFDRFIPFRQKLPISHLDQFDREHAFLFIQPEVLKYRADFAIVFKLERGAPTHRIIVECDGHDFHERTKEQAARDRRRDREMTAAGFKVFRFTGSEIHRDAMRCAQEVASFVDSLAQADIPK